MSFFEEMILAAKDGKELIDKGYCINAQLDDLIFDEPKAELKELGINLHCIDKVALVHIWESDKSSFTKIISTLLWGGIRNSNLSLLKKMGKEQLKPVCDNILLTMRELILADQEQLYWEKLEEAFIKCAKQQEKNNCHLNGVNEAFFTKFFHFYSEAHKSESITKLHPVIGDQWIRLAVCAEMISCNYAYGQIFTIDTGKVFFVSQKGNHAQSYVNMVKFYNKRVNELKRKYSSITPFVMESYLFGQIPINGVCPRCRAKEIVEKG